MDNALLLKMEFDNHKEPSMETIDHLLSTSELVQTLTRDLSKNTLFPIWRILALAEIPYAYRLKYTQDLIEYINSAFATPDGFSITGKSEDLLPCYNAMLIEAYVKLGLYDAPQVKSAVDWILRYQVFGRNEETCWQGAGIKKYGGCMKSTPCFIGIAKTVKALIYYVESAIEKDEKVSQALVKGLNYLLQHNLFQRLSNSEPITKHIFDIAFPQSYHLNLVELLEIAFKANLMNDPRVEKAKEHMISKKMKSGGWKINYIYQADGFVSFDKRGEKGEWVSAMLNKYLGQPS